MTIDVSKQNITKKILINVNPNIRSKIKVSHAFVLKFNALQVWVIF